MGDFLGTASTVSNLRSVRPTNQDLVNKILTRIYIYIYIYIYILVYFLDAFQNNSVFSVPNEIGLQIFNTIERQISPVTTNYPPPTVTWAPLHKESLYVQ